MANFTIILPIFNDWKSLHSLLKKIENILIDSIHEFNIILIDDSSFEINEFKLNQNNFFKKITQITLKQNVGSQKAIATALKYIDNNSDQFGDNFIIMDSDGEDDPKKIIDLLDSLKKKEDIKIVTFNRSIRKESFLFSFMYEIHLLITFLMTFTYTRFGNFSFIKKEIIKEITKKEDLWLAYSATLDKYFKNKFKILAPRKKRISGKSKMSYLSLIKHSISIQAVNKKKLIYSYNLYLILSFLFKSILSNYFFYFLLIIFLFHFLLIIFLNKDSRDKVLFKDCLYNIKSIKNI